MPPVGIEPTTWAGERLQTHALDSAATGTALDLTLQTHALDRAVTGTALDLTLQTHALDRTVTGTALDLTLIPSNRPPCVANRLPASQIPRILQKLTVHHHSQKSPLLIRRPEDPYLNLSPIYAWGFQVVSPLAHACYVPCPSHSTILGIRTVNKCFEFLEPTECDKQIFLRRCFRICWKL